MSTPVAVDPMIINAGDAAWMITATAMVFLMTPALGFFYGGLVDNKNVINTLFLSFVCMGLVVVQWILFGYSLAFQVNTIGIGGGNWTTLTGLANRGLGTSLLSPTYPQLIHVMYQCAFAVITPALISGAIIGRMKLPAYCCFIVLWSTLCYDVEVHWIWSTNGWLANLGAIDFAGGYVVEISSGVSALVASWILGKRVDAAQPLRPAHIPLTVMGAGLLWFGWLGFNGGSANAANGVAGLALVNTNAAAASGLITWVTADAYRGHPSIVGAALGAVVGMVAITPCAGFVAPGWALFIGVAAAAVSYSAMTVKHWLRADDTLDVFIAHGLGGVTGHFCLGLFADSSLNAAGANGAFYGNPMQLWYQVAGVLVTIAYSSSSTAAILLFLKYTIGIRQSEEVELLGLDEALHQETWMIHVRTTDAEGKVLATEGVELITDADGVAVAGVAAEGEEGRGKRGEKEMQDGDSSNSRDSGSDEQHNTMAALNAHSHRSNNNNNTVSRNNRSSAPIDHLDESIYEQQQQQHDIEAPHLNERQASADGSNLGYYTHQQHQQHQQQQQQQPQQQRGRRGVEITTSGPRNTSTSRNGGRGSRDNSRDNNNNRSIGNHNNSSSSSNSNSRVPLNLSQAVAQLVASMALQGHSYDIGISRSC